MDASSTIFLPIRSFSPSVFESVDWTGFPEEEFIASPGQLNFRQISPAVSASQLVQIVDNDISDAPPQPFMTLNSQRAKPLPPERWSQYRPIIVQLYINEERELEDVRRIMSQRYGLNAS
jgi:hypothetical protein